MCGAQCHPSATRGKFRAVSLLFLLLFGETLGSIHIPKEYKTKNLKEPPVITKFSESHTVFQVDDFLLVCEASGNPTPTFRWMKDGHLFKELYGSGSFTANENDDLKIYQGKYRCYASNELGTAETPLINLITESTPVLLKEKRVRKTVNEGDSVVLHCNPPNSSVSPIIHWMDRKMIHINQSERITVGLDGNIYFANVLPEDTREDYTCNSQYIEARTILSKEYIHLIVNSSNNVENRQPLLHRPRGSHTKYQALRGDNLILECIPHGLPTPVVTWERKDAPLSASRVRKLNFDRRLQFKSVSESDIGEYTCTASNTDGHVTHSYSISVEAAPYLTKKPESAKYAPGETVRLDCLAQGIPKPTVSWKINGVLISETANEPRRIVVGGKLILNDVQFGDTAVYQCEATNVHGTLLVNTYIYVIELPPHILTKDDQEYQLTEGATAFLHCSTFGSPRPQISWESDDSGPALSNPKMSQLTNGTLVINNISQEEAGLYMCNVVNTNLSITAGVEVLNKTRVVSPPRDVRVLRGKLVVLHCEYEVDARLLDPMIQWRKDGQKITPSAQDDKYTVFENGSLKITDVHATDTGSYTCEISTSLDIDRATGSVTVMDKPKAPHALLLSEKHNRSVTLSWTAGDDNNSPILEFVIEIREDLNTEKPVWEELKRVSGEIHQLEIPLLPFCTYHFKVAAVNEIGRSDFSFPSESYTTPPAAPDINPQDVRSDSTNPDSMVITWKELDRKHFNGPGFKYKVFWRESADRNQHWRNTSVFHPPLIVNNTGTFTPFEIKVQAVNTLGDSPSPIAAIGHSGEDIPLEAPTNIEVVQINTTAFSVRWTAVSRESVRGHLLGYKIYVINLGQKSYYDHRRKRKRALDNVEDRENQKDSENKETVIVVHGDKKEDAILSDLDFFSNYEIIIKAFNSKGEGPQSEPIKFSTPEGAPGPPSFLRYESPTETKLTLFWGKPLKINGILKSYTLQYQEFVDNQPRDLQIITIEDPTLTDYKIENLDPKSHYIFSLTAFTNAGQGEPIYVNATTLLDGVPPSSVNTTAEETSVNLSWVPGDKHRNIAFIIHYLRKSAGAQWEESEQVNSTQAFYQLQGLKPGTHYRLEIRLNNLTFWTHDLHTKGPELAEVQNGFASQGWFIGLISAIILLLLLLLILCFIKKSKGGKYSVKDREEGQIDSDAKPMKDEAFGEYRSLDSSDNEEKISLSQRSLSANIKRNSDDSLVEYGDSVDIQFNEDGSFIGQYSGRRDAHPYAQGDQESSGPGSPINPNMPPPPSGSFPTSVTGILGGN